MAPRVLVTTPVFGAVLITRYVSLGSPRAVAIFPATILTVWVTQERARAVLDLRDGRPALIWARTGTTSCACQE
jgi:hypothetical protein